LSIDDVCTGRNIALAIGGFFVLVGIILGIVVGATWPILEPNQCVPGTALNEKEQMWCMPEETQDVNVSYSSVTMLVYRVLKSKLPKVSTRTVVYSKEYSLGGHEFTYRGFELMNGSKITGTISSSWVLDNCYLFDSSNFKKFKTYVTSSKKKKKKSSGYYSMKHGYGDLELKSYLFDEPGYYYLVVEHSTYGSVTASFDIAINYAVYDVSSFTPVNCSNKHCHFKDVTPEEMVIAENPHDGQTAIDMYLPDKLDVSTTVLLIVFGSLSFLFGVAFIIVVFYLFRH